MLLKIFDIQAERTEGMTGVLVKQEKIASIGVGISKWITYHGFALNIDPDMNHFRMINPCGLGKPLTSMKALLKEKLPLQQEIEQLLIDCFVKVFSKKGVCIV